jgi:peptide/nickel transport system permease protein
MTRYLLTRALHAGLLLVAISVLLFFFTELVPGDFLDDLKLNPAISASTVAGLRERYGLDEPVTVRYWRWIQSVARGEFGFSLLYERPVGPLLRERAANTLLLTVTATALAWCLAIPIGAWSASRRGGVTDKAAGVVVTALLALPDLLVALGLLLVAVRVGGLPTGGMTSPQFATFGPGDKLADVLAHLLLPVSALCLAILPVLVRHVRATLVETLDAPFIQAAKAIGVGGRRLVYRHALRAAANPLISLLGLSVASLLSASMTIEAVMSWPGLGPLLLTAIQARDVHLIVGVALASTCFLLAGYLLADGLLVLADPRVRTEPQ